MHTQTHTHTESYFTCGISVIVRTQINDTYLDFRINVVYWVFAENYIKYIIPKASQEMSRATWNFLKTHSHKTNKAFNLLTLPRSFKVLLYKHSYITLYFVKKNKFVISDFLPGVGCMKFFFNVILKIQWDSVLFFIIIPG